MTLRKLLMATAMVGAMMAGGGPALGQDNSRCVYTPETYIDYLRAEPDALPSARIARQYGEKDALAILGALGAPDTIMQDSREVLVVALPDERPDLVQIVPVNMYGCLFVGPDRRPMGLAMPAEEFFRLLQGLGIQATDGISEGV